ncbi:hypothetical protein CEUSTIGMA_g6756.t1 [Chlamydomonas eustigma]|uniref:Sec1 family domain-containing protein n=1 Tax=Chlamydomonas eustigma TaxID=1157962 RepID=A0A250X8C2_9CHLO|nr:hypothetical protein CEUSTIGMA_g6756.t1 [Chlamydomonas eustigma]|eukprot:GAX79315.1 hypothetical protein CEUSTIGMA_g6756.t1 [Chlamydomonas eustigma]
MDLVSPCSHGEHPFELAVAAAPRASFKSRAKSSTPNFTEEATHAAKWRSLAMRAHVPVAAAPCSMPLEEASAANGRYSSGTQCTALPAEQLLLGGLDVWEPSDKTCMERMEQLLSRKPKDVLPLLRKWLKEALRHENRNPSVRSKAGSVPLSELSVLITDLASIHSDTTPTVDSRDGGQRGRSTALRYKGLLALTVSVLQAAEGPLAVRWEASAALEKQLLLMMVQAGDMSGVQKTLIEALTNAKANKGPLYVSDVLQLLPLVYSLWPDAAPPGTAVAAAGPFSQPEEQELQHACQQAVLAQIAAAAKGKLEGNDTLSLDCFSSTVIDRMKQACLTGPEGRTAVQKEVRSLLHSFFLRLRYISQSRLPLEELRRVTTSDIFSDTPAAVKPLLQQIGCQLRKGGELPDLMQPSNSSSSLSGLISKGLGRIMMGAAGVSRQVARQNPARSKIVLMFVVGGVSLSEARTVSADMISSSGGARDGGFRSESLVEQEGVYEYPLILVGGTALISPEDVCRKLLVC